MMSTPPGWSKLLPVSNRILTGIHSIQAFGMFPDIWLAVHVGSKMMFPTSLCFIASFLVVGFLLSLAITIRRQRNEVAYQKLNAGDSSDMRSPQSNTTGVGSYQSSARTDYAIPQSSQKVVTYCVIDDRLIDKPWGNGRAVLKLYVGCCLSLKCGPLMQAIKLNTKIRVLDIFDLAGGSCARDCICCERGNRHISWVSAKTVVSLRNVPHYYSGNSLSRYIRFQYLPVA